MVKVEEQFDLQLRKITKSKYRAILFLWGMTTPFRPYGSI
jgi:hypothetical protein